MVLAVLDAEATDGGSALAGSTKGQQVINCIQ